MLYFFFALEDTKVGQGISKACNPLIYWGWWSVVNFIVRVGSARGYAVVLN